MKYLRTPHRFLRHLPVLPFIYTAVVPIVIMDIWVEIYHRVSFPFYGIPYVKRNRYVRIDRHKLQYLNVLQRLNCIYCGYANGALQYWVAIIGETEKYWCSIKHQETEGFIHPPHHREFLEFGDEEAYVREYSSKKTRMI